MKEIPLFPLPLVLFPGGRLPLQIFEVRYLDMIKSCMRENSGFGVVMLEVGNEVYNDSLATIVNQGTYTTIVDFDQFSNGMLGITAEGQSKFLIREKYEQIDHLLVARVEFFDREEELAFPVDKTHLVKLLKSLMKDERVAGLNYNVDFGSAGEVVARLVELLPLPIEEKQRLFEIKRPLERLKELDKVITTLQ
ncbi:MAG: LON peptidase substrate-binding domain-containing protein [Candidatus Azotimanducaceae bacterium]|uniref:Peptidase S16 n=1 Tax=OM182 bacterium TaxID=2510334 RepID=A0A520S224_9GAMM|nr:peptidase S16 [Gammaproteobacteria bacterium]OUV67063.1 MAG: hypothetical protein CBC93_07115 [Gammaproteobacteria bacterium TMED133]RZO76496.1 MAG: peptidase S16 [OM182 bacterium]